MSNASFELIDNVPTYKMFIDGQWVSSSRNVLDDDINPANGEDFCPCTTGGAG